MIVAGSQRLRGPRFDQRRFLRREEDVAGRGAEEVLQHVEIERAIVLGRGHQHGAVGDERHAEEAGA